MTRFENREELADKIDWEGGLWSALEYGIRVDDMPDGDIALQEAWIELQSHFESACRVAEEIYEMLEV